ncbi:SDR family oxidoreductase [Pelotomaculum terephthalicicum JT]|uniref:SDR family NAD(P)-dependent oxidoreductase n=2 Tax=Pelotomaculum TaxID=191373 RepID=UPI001F03C77E|nr:SDR family NAD(P)-dependent oxidoreductase [Pelotomaculum terephthalicicum]MCG9967729.1 SDR family oxidoreductase [Pelotomaculum terephthalicicum JT]
MRFKGKVAVVTGGARGIGEAVTLGLAREGAVVNIVDVLETESNDIVNKIRENGGEGRSFIVDVTKSDQVNKMVEEVIGAYGSIDILVNCAGILIASPIIDCKEEDWDKVLSINLKGIFLSSQAVGKQMIKQRRGSIVNISSTGGISPSFGLSAYSISKAGVSMLTRLMAIEWAAYNIRVNAVCPGPIATYVLDRAYEDPVKRVAREASIPLNRFGTTEEVANAILFLASDEAGYITAENLLVDGGADSSTTLLVDVIKQKMLEKG